MRFLLIFILTTQFLFAGHTEHSSAIIGFQGNTTVTTDIENVNVWHGAVSLQEIRCSDSITCDAGVGVKSITAIADAGGGEITVTSAAHGMVSGDVVVITGTTNYNEKYFIESVTTDTFNVERAFVASETGSATNPSTIRVKNNGGVFVLASANIDPDSALDNFQFCIMKNLEPAPLTTEKVDAGFLSGSEPVRAFTLTPCVPCDVFWLAGMNTSNAGDLMLLKAVLYLERRE